MGRPLPLLVGGGGGGGVKEGDLLVRVDLGLSWEEGVATRKVTGGSCGWSSWGLVARKPGRGISCPEGVDAVHRSWHSAGEPSCMLADVLNE